MLEALKNTMNVTFTENGAKAYQTTQSDLLDFFALGGAIRNWDEKRIVNLFQQAFMEDQLGALRLLFYFRDIRGGQGERRIFRVILKHLAKHYPEVIRKNIHLIPEYGRWDDLYALFDTPCQKYAIQLIIDQWGKDMAAEHPSLMAKWLKSEKASSPETQRLAKITRKGLGLSSEAYRKGLSALRKKIDIVERKISANQWEDIDFEKLPSRASMLYRNAFLRHVPEKYEAYLQMLKEGKKKVNSKTLYPYEIVERALYSNKDDVLFDEMWKSLPDYLNGSQENALAVVDVSGSMSGRPLTVAISLGLYMAERNQGLFHNHFMTFSRRPKLVKVKGETLYEKVKYMEQADWGMNTNIEAVFKTILRAAVEHQIPQEEMVQKLYIISDMEFDRCTENPDEFLFKSLEREYEKYGYQLPKLIFWNVDARHKRFPMQMTDTGVLLVSGFSPSIFEHLMKDEYISPLDLVLDIINSPRYAAIQI